MKEKTVNKPPYNIAVDMQVLYSAHATRGIGSYVRNLLEAIFQLDRTNRYYLVNFYGEAPAKQRLGGGENVYELNLYEEVKGWLSAEKTSERDNFFRKQVQELVKQYKIDFFLIGAVVDPYFIYKSDDFCDTRCVSIAYDLIPLIFDKKYLSDAASAHMYSIWFQQYLYSDFIFTDSECAKDDLIRLLGVDKNRMLSIYAGVAPSFYKKEFSADEKAETFKKFNIKDKYLFCVGADDFRKNLDRLVKSYLSMPKELLEKYQLAITCAISEETVGRLKKYESERGWTDRLVITNYVSDEEMLCLLNNAKLAVFPSLYEGFGLPVVEAWKCEIPLLTSNNSSLGEIANGVSITVDPFSDDAIREGLVYALTEADLDELTEKGKSEWPKYEWPKVALKVIQMYDNIMIMEKIDTNSSEYRKSSLRLKRRCMKNISFFAKLKYLWRR